MTSSSGEILDWVQSKGHQSETRKSWGLQTMKWAMACSGTPSLEEG